MISIQIEETMDDFDRATYDAESKRIVAENYTALLVEGEDHVFDGDGAAEMSGGCARRPQL